MKPFVVIASSYAIFLSGASLLGLLWFGFSVTHLVIAVADSVAGIAGIVCVVRGTAGLLAAVAAIFGIIGVATDAIDYYASSHVPGSYYAWFLMVPLCIAFGVIAVFGASKRKV
ncbi:MAG: hypothetical protein LBE32_02150 [Burkholderiales bacterium]|jgi:hypothetical protein|nr:hypothetical protein [Burkholderiales bacterium]